MRLRSTPFSFAREHGVVVSARRWPYGLASGRRISRIWEMNCGGKLQRDFTMWSASSAVMSSRPCSAKVAKIVGRVLRVEAGRCLARCEMIRTGIGGIVVAM